jgi:hypothetical protein
MDVAVTVAPAVVGPSVAPADGFGARGVPGEMCPAQRDRGTGRLVAIRDDEMYVLDRLLVAPVTVVLGRCGWAVRWGPICGCGGD